MSISRGASLFFSSFLPELALSFLPTHPWGQLEPEAFPTRAYSISFRPKRARHPDPWQHVLTSLASPPRMNGLWREREFWQDACPERCLGLGLGLSSSALVSGRPPLLTLHLHPLPVLLLSCPLEWCSAGLSIPATVPLARVGVGGEHRCLQQPCPGSGSLLPGSFTPSPGRGRSAHSAHRWGHATPLRGFPRSMMTSKGLSMAFLQGFGLGYSSPSLAPSTPHTGSLPLPIGVCSQPCLQIFLRDPPPARQTLASQ